MVEHTPSYRAIEHTGRRGTLLLQRPQPGVLKLGDKQRNGWNYWPQSFLPVETTADEFLDLAVEAQGRDNPLKVLLVDHDAAPLVDVEAFAEKHPNITVVLFDD